MKRISGVRQRKFRRIIILGTVFLVLFSVIAILSYQLYRATRMNQYSKNIWLNHNYFLNDYDADDAEKEQPKAQQAGEEQFAEQSWPIVADGNLSFLAKTDSLSKVIHQLYRDGTISSYELNEVYFMIKIMNIRMLLRILIK